MIYFRLNSMKLKHFSLIFSLLGILILYVLSSLSQPTIITLDKISEYEGKTIETEGVVTNYQTTKYGSQLITIEDYNTSATIFIEGKIDVEYGDRIKCVGEVQKYKNSWEIVTNDERQVKIIEKWQNISFPLWQLAENTDRYEGLNVNVTGYIESLTDTSLTLVDLEEKHCLKVLFNYFENQNFYIGKKVSVKGVFYFDEKNFEYVLKIGQGSAAVSILPEEP